MTIATAAISVIVVALSLWRSPGQIPELAPSQSPHWSYVMITAKVATPHSILSAFSLPWESVFWSVVRVLVSFDFLPASRSPKPHGLQLPPAVAPLIYWAALAALQLPVWPQIGSSSSQFTDNYQAESSCVPRFHPPCVANWIRPRAAASDGEMNSFPPSGKNGGQRRTCVWLLSVTQFLSHIWIPAFCLMPPLGRSEFSLWGENTILVVVICFYNL